MLLEQKVKVKWNSFTKEHYENKGYVFTKMSDEFEVDISDLLPSSSARVKVKCSVCGKINEPNYSNFTRMKMTEYKCKKAHSYDYYRVLLEKFNCELLSPLENHKSNFTFKCSCGDIAEKNFNEFMRNPGCKKCNKEKHFENMRKALQRNGFVPTSRQQIYIYNLLEDVELNYFVKYYFLDIAFLDEKIYIEYDGGLHDGAVKFGTLNEEEFNHKQFIRTNFFFKEGWKEIRIISRDDLLPTKEEIVSFISYAKDYLNTGRHWIHLDIDESKIKCSQFEKDVNFKKLKHLKGEVQIENKYK